MNSAAPRRTVSAHSGRTVARKLALQALYRWQLNEGSFADLLQEFEIAEDSPKADRGFFTSLVQGVLENHANLNLELGAWCDRPVAELDPIERAALWSGLQELKAHPETPFRVVISQTVNLVKRFGATEAHTYVNAILDRAGRQLRPLEH